MFCISGKRYAVPQCLRIDVIDKEDQSEMTTTTHPIVPTTPNPPSLSIESYLNEHFPEERVYLKGLVLQNYGVAYKHCLTEQTLRSIANQIGIVWPVKGTIKPKTFPDTGLVIKVDDLARWAGLNPGSFKNIWASVAKARVARELLRQQNILSLDTRDIIAIEVLKVLLSGEQVEYPDLEQTFSMQEGMWDAIRMTADGMDRLIKRVNDKFGSGD